MNITIQTEKENKTILITQNDDGEFCAFRRYTFNGKHYINPEGVNLEKMTPEIVSWDMKKNE
jgi:hypothetical protein